MKRGLKFSTKLIIGLLGNSLLYLFFWPVPIDPAPWTPPEAPKMEGVYAPNRALAKAERIEVPGPGPEDIDVDPQGRIVVGVYDGRVLRRARSGDWKVWADTGGRPLGLAMTSSGTAIIADTKKGLLSLSPGGKLKTLSTEHGGLRYAFADDLDIGKDGTIYFSDASHRFGVEEYKLDLFEHRPNGRLLSYDPQSGKTELLLDKLYFANGVAVSPDQRFVLVVETGKYRVLKYWLAGPKKGQKEIFIENLPGFPDGISTGSQVFWLAIASPRTSALDKTLPIPWMRKVIVRLPKFVQPAPQHYGLVLGLDASGKIVHNLQDPAKGSFSPITSVQEVDGFLYLGSLIGQRCAKIELSKALQAAQGG